jgi:hypothetical protein
VLKAFLVTFIFVLTFASDVLLVIWTGPGNIRLIEREWLELGRSLVMGVTYMPMSA